MAAVDNQIDVHVPAKSDQEIGANVRATLRADPGLQSLGLNVTVENGVVHLQGHVAAVPQRHFAEWTVSRLLGVREVVNDITLDPNPRTDAELRHVLQAHFASNPTFNENDVAVEVTNGSVTLTGTVDSALEKTWATADAWIPGVRRVDASGLGVHFAQKGWRTPPVTLERLTDEDIRRNIKDQYVYDPRVSSVRLHVEVNDRIVTLTGNVTYRRVKNAAAEIAQQTAGVKRVIDRLEVRPEKAVTDAQIADAIRRKFATDSVVHGETITVDVDGGNVILAGTVADPLSKWTAEDLAEQTMGATEVENRIRLAHGPSPGATLYYQAHGSGFRPWFAAAPAVAPKTDAELVDVVRAQLASSPVARFNGVHVTANAGIVTLSGGVESWLARRVAASEARYAGAKDVINQLQVNEAAE